jgi:hypothetical protein
MKNPALLQFESNVQNALQRTQQTQVSPVKQQMSTANIAPKYENVEDTEYTDYIKDPAKLVTKGLVNVGRNIIRAPERVQELLTGKKNTTVSDFLLGSETEQQQVNKMLEPETGLFQNEFVRSVIETIPQAIVTAPLLGSLGGVKIASNIGLKILSSNALGGVAFGQLAQDEVSGENANELFDAFLGASLPVAGKYVSKGISSSSNYLKNKALKVPSIFLYVISPK